MKRLEISKLMDEYQDNEFFPKGGTTADTQVVKDQVLAQATVEKRKKPLPRTKKMLLAAALAAVLVVLVGAGLPYIQYQLIGGTLSYEQTTDGRITAFVHNREVVKYEDGRLIFTADDGQSIDVTDLISDDTPYIYDASDPDAETTYYVVIGGTPDSFGWFEWIQTPYAFDDGAHNFDENGNPVSIISNFELGNPENNWRSIGQFGMATVQLEPEMDLPWLLAALDELGIPYEYAPPENLE